MDIQRSPHSFLEKNGQLLRWLIIISLAVAAGTLISMASGVLDRVHITLLLIVFATLFAYAVYPPIRWLSQRGVPVAIAGAIVYFGLFLIIVAALAWLTPTIVAQGTQLAQNYPTLIATAQRQIADPAKSPLLAHFPPAVRDKIAENAGKAGTMIGGFAAGFGTKTLTIVTGATAVVADIAITLGLASLFISDLSLIQHFALRIVRPAARPAAISFMREVDEVIGGFVRGQLLIAGGIAVLATLLMLILGVPYSLLLGVLAGLINIVPIIGAFVAMVPIAFVAFFTVGWLKAVIGLVVLFVIFQIQQQVLNPLFVSKTVGVTPLILFLALLVGSEAYGVLGTLLAIPVAGIIRVAADRLFPDDVSVADASIALDGPQA